MNKAYSRINWENYPSDATPVNKVNLNRLDSATDILDDRVITLDTTKATKTEVATLVMDVAFEESTGIITVTKKNGSKITIDTQMGKIAVNFDYDPVTEQIILALIDGTKQYIDLSALITQYEFLDTDTVAFTIGTDGKVSAIVKEGSIEEKHLEPNYLAKIKVEAAKAETSRADAAASATKAESYAVGGTGSREGEDSDNAKYYYQQAKDVSEGLKGGLQPHGTCTFADLPALADVNAGWMFNISDEFTTTDDFKEGSGNVIPAGANIYKTSDGKWDVLAGTPVTGVRGAKETVYHRGNVSLSAAAVGAVAEDGDASDTTVTFLAASKRANITTGEKVSALFSKIAKWLSDLKTVAFTGNYNDLSNKPTIPANTWRGIQNNLTSTSTTDSLAANQGRLLANGSARDSTKLPLSGGTVTGGITFNPGSGGYGWTDYYSNGSNVLSIFGQNSDGFVRSNANSLYLQCKTGSQGIGVQYNTGVAAPLYAASFTQNSSKRYKKNIQPISEARAKKILDMSVVTYDYIDGVVGEDVQYDRTGVIAEDTQGIIKEAVSYREINGKKVPDGVDYSKFVPYLIRMLQLQQEQIDDLTARLR